MRVALTIVTEIDPRCVFFGLEVLLDKSDGFLGAGHSGVHLVGPLLWDVFFGHRETFDFFLLAAQPSSNPMLRCTARNDGNKKGKTSGRYSECCASTSRERGASARRLGRWNSLLRTCFVPHSFKQRLFLAEKAVHQAICHSGKCKRSLYSGSKSCSCWALRKNPITRCEGVWPPARLYDRHERY